MNPRRVCGIGQLSGITTFNEIRHALRRRVLAPLRILEKSRLDVFLEMHHFQRTILVIGSKVFRQHLHHHS